MTPHLHQIEQQQLLCEQCQNDTRSECHPEFHFVGSMSSYLRAFRSRLANATFSEKPGPTSGGWARLRVSTPFRDCRENAEAGSQRWFEANHWTYAQRWLPQKRLQHSAFVVQYSPENTLSQQVPCRPHQPLQHWERPLQKAPSGAQVDCATTGRDIKLKPPAARITNTAKFLKIRNRDILFSFLTMRTLTRSGTVLEMCETETAR